MKSNECRVCGTNVKKIFSAKILNKYDVGYYHCPNCHFLQTEYPYWLEESYKESMNFTDTGILKRNTLLTEIAALIICSFFDRNKKFLDYSGGYGIGTRMLRDIGLDFYWQDPYTKNILAKGFEYTEQSGPVELVTSFESFEHFVNPKEELKKILNISRNIIFSTELLPNPIPIPKDYWYYGLEHGQHIAFYSSETLNFIAKENGLNYYAHGNIHLFSTKKINAKLFTLLFLFRNSLLSFLRRKLKSKTFDDMNHLIEQEEHKK